MAEEFEKDCEHTAEIISRALDKGKEQTSFLIYDVNAELFEKNFVAKVAELLGGKVDGDEMIIYRDVKISFVFTTSRMICGYFENLEVSVYFIRTS
jgi:hypothetical protein